MCGIIGYSGYSDAVPILMSGLGALEYRGYDSAGAAVFVDGRIKTVRAQGRISALRQKLGSEKLCGNVGIAHTRWATHGEPSERNAHPHGGRDGIFSVVHNGIIENYLPLRAELESHGRIFSSDTDTEAAVQLLEENYDGDPIATICRTVKRLRGSYALAILCRDFPQNIYCVCQESPLLVGTGSAGTCTASDISAFPPGCTNVFRMKSGELAVINGCDAAFYSNDGAEIKKIGCVCEKAAHGSGKGQFDYYMEKEIYEQPEALRRTISEHVSSGHLLSSGLIDGLCRVTRISIVGCGSAYHAAVVGKYVFESLLRIPTEARLASEFRYSSPLVDATTLVIIISQSGETADTIAALREAVRAGARTVSVVNVEDSTIARESETVFLTRAGREIAVATTKAYSCQLAALYILAAYIGSETGSLTSDALSAYLSELSLLPDKVAAALNTAPHTLSLAEKFADRHYAYYIGRNLDYACAMEASLKLKEISYVHSEAYAAGELKHGTISLIESGTLVAAMCCCERLAEKTAGNIEETMARGAEIICTVTKKTLPFVGKKCDLIIVPQTIEAFVPSIEIIPMQLFSFFSAKIRKCDIDKPRNLAKSVTVE